MIDGVVVGTSRPYDRDHELRRPIAVGVLAFRRVPTWRYRADRCATQRIDAAPSQARGPSAGGDRDPFDDYQTVGCRHDHRGVPRCTAGNDTAISTCRCAVERLVRLIVALVTLFQRTRTVPQVEHFVTTSHTWRAWIPERVR